MSFTSSISRAVVLVAATFLFTASASAGVAEAAKSAASATQKVGNRADNVIRRGIQSGNQAAENATKAAEGPIDRLARKIGLPRGPVKPANNERDVSR